MTEDMVLYEAAKKINGEEKEENSKEQDLLQQIGKLEKGGEK